MDLISDHHCPQRRIIVNSNPITTQLEIDLKALLSDTDSTTSEKLDQMSRAFIRVTNQLEDKVRILSQVVCTPEVFVARKRPGIREESSRFIKAYELPACWVHGVEENQEKLAVLGEAYGARPGRPRPIRVTITPGLEVVVDNMTVGTVFKHVVFFKNYLTLGAIDTIGTLCFSTSEDCWCVLIGDSQ